MTPWKVYEPTAENLALLKKACGGYQEEPPDFAQYLLQNPISRLIYKWRLDRHYGLSPFAVADIVNKSPRRVLKQASREWGINLYCCTETQLPVFMSEYYPNFSCRLPEPRETSVETFCASYDRDIKECLIQDGEKGPNWEERQMKHLLELYGGLDWRQHCTVDFHLTNRSITPNKELFRRVYDLDLLR
jgi:hypothetical protein